MFSVKEKQFIASKWEEIHQRLGKGGV